MSKLYDKLGEKTFDNLINSTFPPAEVFHVELEADNGELKRGSVLARVAASEKYILLGDTPAKVKETLSFTGTTATLNNAWLNGSVVSVYTDSTKATPCVVTTDYTAAYTGGVLTITAVAEGALDDAEDCYVEVGVNLAGVKANAILADDIDTDVETVAGAYRTGHFNRNRLIVNNGYTLTSEDEETLRGVGILMSDALN